MKHIYQLIKDRRNQRNFGQLDLNRWLTSMGMCKERFRTAVSAAAEYVHTL